MSCTTACNLASLWQSQINAQGILLKLYRGSNTIDTTSKRVTINDMTYLSSYYAKVSFDSYARDTFTNIGVDGGITAMATFGGDVVNIIKDRDVLTDEYGREFMVVSQPAIKGKAEMVECMLYQLAYKPKGVA